VSYAIYVGKNRTRNGMAYLAGYGDEPSSHWLEIVPRATHPTDAEIEVGVDDRASMPGVRTTIPQVAETARHLRVSYTAFLGVAPPLTNGGLNEHGVAVRDVWSPSHDRLVAMTPRDQHGPNYSDLARLVLERATSARDGVELIGRLIAEHGESTYGGNSHLIADADEAWVVIEFAGGMGLWVAERLGPDDIRVSRPGYILDVPLDLRGRDDFLAAPHLIATAIERGWWSPDEERFDVNAVYGDGKGRWDGVRWIEAELEARADRPERLDLPDLIWALRTERLTGDSAGYGQVVPLHGNLDPRLRELWHAPIGPVVSPLTPFFLGIEHVPPEFRQHRYLSEGEEAAFMDAGGVDRVSGVAPAVEGTRSAVEVYRRLWYTVAEHYEVFLPEIVPVWDALERDMRNGTEGVREMATVAIEGGRDDLVAPALTSYCSREALRALDIAEAMLVSIDARSRVLFGVRDEPGWVGPTTMW
jgi:dipeptidase